MQRTAGLSQEEFAEKTGLTANYISTVERGMSFPRCEKLIILLNGLEVSADAIFCDVLDHSTSYKASELSKKLDSLPPQAQKRILQMKETMLQSHYSPDCMDKRNRYMVDQADVLTVVWDGSPSGTGKTVRYAHQQGKPVIIINPVSLDVTQE